MSNLCFTTVVPQTPYSSCTTGEIRLIGGMRPSEGRVELCVNNAWGTVCDDGWSVQDSNVACKVAGHQAFGISVNKFLIVFFLLQCI